MTHLTESELSAHLDGALPPRDRERADAHLATCATCRDALARLAAQDRSLAGVLEHDPGETYFDAFAARVENRLRAAGLAGAQARAPRAGGAWGWLHSPRALTWVGAAAAVVVGAGVVMMTGREVEMQNLHRPNWTEHRAPAPPSEGTLRADKKAAAPQPPVTQDKESNAKNEVTRALGSNAPSAVGDLDRKAGAGHVVEVKRNEIGEEAPVTRERAFASPPPAAAPPVSEGGAVYARKERRAEPAGGAKPEMEKQQAERPVDALANPMTAQEATAAVRRCGTVHDASGRPVQGAQVIVAETGASVSSAADGSFCIEIPPNGRTLIAMAVGFEAGLRALPSGDRSALALTLRAVPVVGDGLALKTGEAAPESRLKLNSGTTSGQRDERSSDSAAEAPLGAAKGLAFSTPAPRAIAMSDPFAALPESARISVSTARILEVEAGRAKSASQYEGAALMWERALRQSPRSAAANDLRYQIALARNHAWRIEPIRERAIAALSSTSDFLVHEPAGPRHDEAAGWLDPLRWGATRASYR